MLAPFTVKVGYRAGLESVEKPPCSPAECTYAVTETDLNLAIQVHRANTGFVGPVTTEGAPDESSSAGVKASLESCGCGEYDRSGINPTSKLDEPMVVLPSATKASSQRPCKASEKCGVSAERLLTVGHKRSSAAQCAAVQKAGVVEGGQVPRPETPRSTAGPAATGSGYAPPTATSNGKYTAAVVAVASLHAPSAASTDTSIGGRGGRAAAVAAPGTLALGRSSGRKRRKTRRAMEAAEVPDESDASADSAESARVLGWRGSGVRHRDGCV